MSEIIQILPGYLTFILMTAFLAGGSARLTSRFFPGESLPSRVLIILFLSLLFGHLIILALGACHLLTRPLLFAAAAVYGFTAWAIGRKNLAPEPRSRSLTWFEAVVIVLVVGYVAWFGVTGLLHPPTGVDDLEYHLPFTAQVLQRGDLDPFFTPYTGPIYYPQTIEIGYLWHLMPLQNDFLLNLGNLPFLLLLALAARQILREWGVSRNYAALAMPLLLYAKIVSKQAWVAHVDVPLAALFITACLFLVRFARVGKGRELVMVGVTAGLLLGSKYSALGYAAFIVAAFFALELQLGGGLKKSLLLTAVAGYVIAMVGGYFYLRNFIVTGTPLYPAGISILGLTIFPSGSYFFIKDMSQATLVHTILDRPWAIERLANGLVTGVMFWTAIALPVSLLAPLDKTQRRRAGRPPVPFTVYLLWALTFLTLVLYLNTPYAGAWSPESKLD